MTTVEAKRKLTYWFRQWRDPLHKFLLGRSGVRAADVEDVGQEVFLRLMRYGKGELVEHPRAYLYKIAANVAAEWSMRASNRSPHDDRGLETLVDSDQPDTVLLRTQSRDEVNRALGTLSAQQLTVLRLFFDEELGHRQIAERTGQTLRSVRRHFARGYEKLRHELDPHLLSAYERGAMNHGRD